VSGDGRSTATVARQSTAERDKLLEQYLPLVRFVLGRLVVTLPRTLDRDDLFSSGVFGLMHAAATFDANRGASFKTFAYTAIRGAILDELRRHDPIPRSRRDRLRRMEEAAAALANKLLRSPRPEELAAALGISEQELDEDLAVLRTANVLSLEEPAGEDSELGQSVCISAQIDPLDAAATAEQKVLLGTSIGKLPDMERRVVVLYYHEGLLLKEIGDLLSVSESRVSQILTRAVVRLRQMMDDGSESPAAGRGRKEPG
jgi:RNA polymerase sigma factor for flagellar operon FliA